MDQYVGAIDQGTTSTRFVIVDRQGHPVAMDQREHRQIYAQPGWVEHDPLEIRDRTFEVIRGALQKAGLKGQDLAAIGVTNQRETTVVWDPATGRPHANAIVWQDTRTDEICRELAADQGQDRFRPRTGLPLATYFSGPKVKWLLDRVPGLRSAAATGRALFGNIDSWLIWWLTGGPQGGVHVTDVTNASRTMLMNLATLAWDPELLAAFSIPPAMLPAIKSSSEIYGQTTLDGVFGAGIPVAGDLGDQQAALFGQACYEIGQAKNTYGTGCFMLLNTGTQLVHSKAGLLTTVGYRLGTAPAVYALEGSVAIGGSLVQWFRDGFGLIQTSAQIEELAASVADSGGVYFVPAFSGLFAPYWRSDARGLIIGLTHYVHKGHLARAVLEATAFQTKEVFEAMSQDAALTLSTLKVDGGMVANELLMQFQADILGVPVIRPRITETTVLGAAYAAGLAVGYWSGPEEIQAGCQADREWRPRMSQGERDRRYAGWLKAVQRTLGWVE